MSKDKLKVFLYGVSKRLSFLIGISNNRSSGKGRRNYIRMHRRAWRNLITNKGFQSKIVKRLKTLKVVRRTKEPTTR